MLETYRRQNCEHGHKQARQVGWTDRNMKGLKHVRPSHCPSVPAAELRSFKLQVPTVQVPSRTGHPPAVYDTDLSSPAHIHSLKQQKRKA